MLSDLNQITLPNPIDELSTNRLLTMTRIDGSKIMELTSPYRALDAAIVPITISFKIDQDGEEYIRDLTLIVDENPSPLVSKFKFTKKSKACSMV